MLYLFFATPHFAETVGFESCCFIAPLFPAHSSFLPTTDSGTWCGLKPNPNRVALQSMLPAKLRSGSWCGSALQISFVGRTGFAPEAREVIAAGTAQEVDLQAVPPGDAPGYHNTPVTLSKKFLLVQEVVCLVRLWIK